MTFIGIVRRSKEAIKDGVTAISRSKRFYKGVIVSAVIVAVILVGVYVYVYYIHVPAGSE